MNSIRPVLKKVHFLHGIPENKYENVLTCLRAKRKTFSSGESIVNVGSCCLSGIILSGAAEVVFYDEIGNQINIDHLHSSQIFGLGVVLAGRNNCPVQIRTLSECEILFLDFSRLLDPSSCTCQYRMQITANLLKTFAETNLFLNLKLRISCQKHLRNKIKIYLQHQRFSETGEVQLPFNRQQLADFLYADRSALSRELGRLRNEGILTFSGRKIVLLDKSFLLS